MLAQAPEESRFTIASYRHADREGGAGFPSASDSDLVDGFPLLMNVTTGAIVEPVFRYLYERAVRTTRLRLTSARAAADNLRLWWGYLEWRQLPYDQATSGDIEAYHRGLKRLVSPQTGTRIAEGTLRQRMTHVVEFYRWANARGLTTIADRFLADKDNLSGGRPLESRVHALTYEEWRLVRPLVGPLPTDSDYHPEQNRCRDRLTWELMVHSGMRRMEMCAITLQQVRSLIAQTSASDNDFALRTFRLTEVKGGPRKARDALVPVWLIRNLEAYARGAERQAAEDTYARYNCGALPDRFFLNHANSSRAPGAPLKEAQVDSVFNQVMRQAGLIETTQAVDPATGRTYERVVATHCVHDLRHTAAVWRYMAERACGNPAPWNSVQVMLGHTNASTTTKIYLQITNVFEAAVSDAALHFFRRLGSESSVGPR